jgi:osmotically-inducible protein OsmY
MPVCVELSGVSASHELRVESPLSARVKRRLQQCGYRPVGQISVHEHEGVLTLYGNVASFYLKQIAQETAAKVPGVERINNRVQVIDRVK